MEKVYEEIEALLYRREKLNERLMDIEKTVGGLRFPYYHMESGRFQKGTSTATAAEFVKELMECLNAFRAYHIHLAARGERDDYARALKEKGEKSGFFPEEKEFYEALLYILLGLGLFKRGEEWQATAGTWEAVIERLDSMKYRTARELYIDIVHKNEIIDVADGTLPGDYTMREPTGFYGLLTYAFRMVTGEPIVSLLTEAEYNAAVANMDAASRNLLEELKKNRNYVDNVEGDLIFYEEDFEDENENGVNALAKYFSDVEYFKKCCRVLLKESSVHWLSEEEIKDNVVNAIYLFLEKTEVGSWLEDDRFFTVYTYMKQVCKYARTECEV